MSEKGRFRGKTVGVFLGGESSEREVSLRTGAAAVAALRRKGYEVREIDVRGDWLSVVRDSGVEVAFLALHGRFGEDVTKVSLRAADDVVYTLRHLLGECERTADGRRSAQQIDLKDAFASCVERFNELLEGLARRAANRKTAGAAQGNLVGGQRA